MKRKIIHFKPGTITLYDKTSDDYFWGRMLVNFGKNFSETARNIRDNEEIQKEQVIITPDQITPKAESLPETVTGQGKKLIGHSQMLIYKTGLPKSQEQPPAPSPAAEPSGPRLIDFNFFYRIVFQNWLFPLLRKRMNEIQSTNFSKIMQKGRSSVFNTETVSGKKIKFTLSWRGVMNQTSAFRLRVKPNYKLWSRISFGVTVASFILLALYFTASQIDLSSIAYFNNKDEEQKNSEIGFQKPQRQFEPTPDPTPSSREFKLTIPEINLVSDVTPNVDLSDEIVYKRKLYENGVAHALGSYFPGEDGPVYLFAHSTDTLANIPLFNAKFYALKELDPGDTIEISYHGKKYNYSITGKQIIDPLKIEIIQNTPSKLVLQTCWPPGTDWQRLVIFADPI